MSDFPASSGGSGGSSVKQRIIEAALALIAEEGLGAVTMMRIAKHAGVSRQTLYNHYSDIDGIVAAAISRHNRESMQRLDAALQVVDRPSEKLEQLVRHVVSMGAHADHAPGIQQGLSADARALLSTYDDQLDGRIREIVEAGQRAGDFRPDLSLAIDSGLIRHILNGLLEQVAQTPDEAPTIAAVGTRTILAAVGAASGL